MKKKTKRSSANSKHLTRKQLVKVVADLVHGEDLDIDVDADIVIQGRIAWLSYQSADLVDLHLLDDSVGEFEPEQKATVDFSQVIAFNKRIKVAMDESDRLAELAGNKTAQDKAGYFDDIQSDADKINQKR